MLAGVLNDLGNLSKFIESLINLLQNRMVYVRCKGKYYRTRITNLGLPQEDILSPLLYASYMTKLEQQLLFPVKFLQYADDLFINMSHKNIQHCQNIMNYAIKVQTKWIKLSQGLELNYNKSEVTHFPRHRLNN